MGFQTKLKYPEQIRVFRLIPGMEKAEFLRLGSIHRNTFIHSPGLLSPALNFLEYPQLFLAGQISGVEGYVESAAMVLLAGINAARQAQAWELASPPRATALGALVHHLTDTGTPGTSSPYECQLRAVSEASGPHSKKLRGRPGLCGAGLAGIGRVVLGPRGERR